MTRLTELQTGCDGYAAPAPSQEPIVAAGQFVGILRAGGCEDIRIAPSVVGGIGITQRRGRRKVYVEFFDDGKVFALSSDGSSEPTSKGVSWDLESFGQLGKEMRAYV